MISIVIPVYGVEDYIEDCLASVVAQTYAGPIECILVDDCSPDRSMERAARFIDMYSGSVAFRIVRHECNRGLSAARNTGTELVRGEWVWFVDSDDTLPPDALQIMMDAVAAAPTAQIVAGHHRNFGECCEEGNEIPYTDNDGGIEIAMGNREVRRLLFDFKKSVHSVWTKLVRRDALGLLRFCQGMLCEDEEWNFHLIMNTDCAVLTRNVVYNYRQRENSIMTDNVKARARINDILLSFMRCSSLVSGEEKGSQGCWMLYQIIDLDTELRWRNGDLSPRTNRHLRAMWQVVRRLRRVMNPLRNPSLWASLMLFEIEFRLGIKMSHPLFWPIHRGAKMFYKIYKQ